MKFLKKIGIGLLVILASLLILALFISNDFKYEKSIAINAPLTTVWQHCKSIKAMEEWSPWNDYDPNMQKTFSGTAGGIGESISWQSEVEKVGNGRNTITHIEAPNLIKTEMVFLTPYESEANEYVRLTEKDGVTTAAWGFTSDIPYPFNLMKLFMNPDTEIGPDFELGLTKLKTLAEDH